MPKIFTENVKLPVKQHYSQKKPQLKKLNSLYFKKQKCNHKNKSKNDYRIKSLANHKSLFKNIKKNNLFYQSVLPENQELPKKNNLLDFLSTMLFFSSYGPSGTSLIFELKNFISHTFHNIYFSQKRRKLRKIIKYYNIENRQLFKHSHDKKLLQTYIKEIKHESLSSNQQIIFNRIIEIKSILFSAISIAEKILQFVGKFAPHVLCFVPGFAIAVAFIPLVDSIIHASTNIIALNNLASATTATTDPLLLSLAKHVKQERTINARVNLLKSSINTASLAVNIASAINPASMTVSSIVAMGCVNAGSVIGFKSFNYIHQQKLQKQRNKNLLLHSKKQLLSMATDNIGVAERLFLQRLRYSHDEKELKESVQFLINLGITKNTIMQIQLSPYHIAEKLLMNNLYKYKVNFKGLKLKQTAKTAFDITGARFFATKINNCSSWLKNKIISSKSHSLSLT